MVAPSIQLPIYLNARLVGSFAFHCLRVRPDVATVVKSRLNFSRVGAPSKGSKK
jgi:hypothetical protein